MMSVSLTRCRRVVLGGCVTLVFGCEGGTGPDPAPPPALAGRLVFQSDRDGPLALYSMRPDGSAVTRLSAAGAYDTEPAVSPDGERIAFSRSEGDVQRIYVMNGDGSGVTPLTSGLDDHGQPSVDTYPAWSPDGLRLVFTSYRTGCGQLFTMRSDGSDPTPLTACQGEVGDPAWSPDGQSIAFLRAEGVRRDIWIIGAGGEDERNVTDDELVHDYAPAWAPDGRLYWASTRGGNTLDIWSMNSDGSDAVQLTDGPGDETGPAVSEDGMWLAYTASSDGNADIWVAATDGTAPERLTTTTSLDLVAAWGPTQ